jgi:hypothetical protein
MKQNILDIVGQNSVIITQALNRTRKKEREICVNISDKTAYLHYEQYRLILPFEKRLF